MDMLSRNKYSILSFCCFIVKELNLDVSETQIKLFTSTGVNLIVSRKKSEPLECVLIVQNQQSQQPIHFTFTFTFTFTFQRMKNFVIPCSRMEGKLNATR